jgi:WD40 repeat protein
VAKLDFDLRILVPERPLLGSRFHEHTIRCTAERVVVAATLGNCTIHIFDANLNLIAALDRMLASMSAHSLCLTDRRIYYSTSVRSSREEAPVVTMRGVDLKSTALVVSVPIHSQGSRILVSGGEIYADLFEAEEMLVLAEDTLARREVKDAPRFYGTALDAFGSVLVGTVETSTTVQVWDSLTGIRMAPFRAHKHYVNKVAFLGDHLITCSSEGNAKLWRLCRDADA